MSDPIDYSGLIPPSNGGVTVQPTMPSTGQTQPIDYSGLIPQGNAGKSTVLQQLAAQEQAQNQQQAPQNAFMDKLDIFNRGFERYALGGLQLLNAGVRGTLGYLPGVGNAIVQNSMQLDKAIDAVNANSEANYQAAYKRTPSPVVNALGQLGGATIASAPAIMGASAAVPASMAGGLGAASIEGAAAGAGAGALDYSANPNDRLQKTLMSGAIGAAVPSALQILGNTANATGITGLIQKIFAPQSTAVKTIANKAIANAGGDTEKALADIQAAQEAGIGGRTPGDVLGGIVKADEGKLSVPEELRADVVKAYNNNLSTATSNIQQTIDNMAPSGTKDVAAQSFNNMKNQFVDESGQIANTTDGTVPKFIQDNPILQDKYNQVNNAVSQKYQELAPNSVAQLHKMKDLIDTDLYNSKPSVVGTVLNPMSEDQQAALMEANGTLKTVLNQSPDYQQAMAASQKLIIQDKYQNLMDSNKLMTTVLKNPVKQDQFIKDVVTTGGDPQQVQQFIKYADSIKDTSLKSLMNKIPSNNPTFEKQETVYGTALKFLKDISLSGYNKALLNVTLSGDQWADQVGRVLQSQTPAAKLGNFVNTIAQAAGKLSPKLQNMVDTINSSLQNGNLRQLGQTAAGASLGVSQADKIQQMQKYGINPLQPTQTPTPDIALNSTPEQESTPTTSNEPATPTSLDQPDDYKAEQ